MPVYTKNNHRINITRYWQQFYPDYKVPAGYHVHHRKPRCICKLAGWSDEQINHPRNLIVLHPDDHYSCHRLRGDVCASGNFLKIAGLNQLGDNHPRRGKIGSFKGKQHSTETKKKMSLSATGRKCSDSVRANMSKVKKGKNHPMYGKTQSSTTKQRRYDSSAGENHPNFKGWYHTPFGSFSGSTQQNIIGDSLLVKYCKNSKTIISRIRYSQSSYLQSLGEHIIGKSFNEIGFWFELK